MDFGLIKQFFINIFSFDERYPLLFTQFYFWAFFVVVFAGFCILKNKRLLRNSYLFFVSVLFYYKTSGLFVLILIFSTIFGFFIGKGICRSDKNGYRKFLVTLGVVVNLAILCYFKYAYFFTDSYNALFHSNVQVFT